MAVNTKQVQRRPVRYATLDDALQDMRKLAAWERDGRLDPLGNWTLGQAIGHIATWAEFAYEAPTLPRPPFLVRLLMPLMKKRFLTKGLPAGVAIPGVEGGTLGTEAMPTAAALDRFAAIARRLQREAPTQPSPAFGRLTHDEFIQLQLRHAELHLSFFKEKVP